MSFLQGTEKILVKELASRGLDGKMISAQPQGKTIDQLNWNAGFAFSLVRFNPKIFDPTDNKENPLGVIQVEGIVLDSSNASAVVNTGVSDPGPGMKSRIHENSSMMLHFSMDKQKPGSKPGLQIIQLLFRK